MKLNKTLWMAASMLFATALVSCSDDKDPVVVIDPVPVVAAFDAALEGFTVTITNKTVGADTYAWDFGDDETSTEKSPAAHTYAAAGTYTIELVASNADETKTVTKSITIEEVGQDPMTLITGGSSKTWVLAPEANAISFGPTSGPWNPANSPTVWWGNLEDQVEGRACLFQNEYTFSSDGKFSREVNGSIWKEWKVFDAVSGEGCLAIADGATTKTRLDGDPSAWMNGDYDFEIAEFATDTIFNYTLTTSGAAGGYIGHYVSGTNTSAYAPQDTYSYGILTISEDRLELISYGWGGDDIDNNTPDGVAHDPTVGSRWYRVNMVPKP